MSRNTMRRRLGISALVVAFGLGLTGCGGAAGDAGGTISWRLAETHPRDYPTTQADIWFADQLRERSNGRIDVTVYPDAQLGEERDVLEQLQLGSVEMNRTNANLVAEFVPSWKAFGLPYIFDDSEHFWNFLTGDAGKEKLAELEQAGFTGLTYYDSGARSLYTTGQAVDRPEDLAGRNMRVQPGSVTAEVIEAMGGSATTMAFSEVYSALETGVIDGAENNLPSYVSTRHYEVADHITLNEHQRVPEVLMISNTAWEQLGDEDRKLVQDVARESTEVQRDLWEKEVEESRATLEEAGVDINEVSDRQVFRDSVADLNNRYAQEFGPFLDAVAAARG